MSSPPPKPTVSAGQGPSFKDQTREATGANSAAPIRSDPPPALSGSSTAEASSNTAIENENRQASHQQQLFLTLEQERLQLERERHQLEQERMEMQQRQQEPSGVAKKHWLIVGLFVFVVIVATAVGIAFSTRNISPPPAPIVPPTPTISTRASSIQDYINSITLTNIPLDYPSQATPQERALQWLIVDDQSTDASDLLSLRQRFVLATMWFANGPFDSAHTDTWLSSTDVCGWESVSNCENGEVTRLWLGGDGLSGTIPVDLGLLTKLTELSCQSNELTGQIPSEISQLTALQLLYVYDNELTGRMPFCDSDSSRPNDLRADCDDLDCSCCTICSYG